jgi:SAM-dependent methyltransferase
VIVAMALERIMGSVYRGWNSLRSFGPRYTFWQLRKVVFGGQLRKSAFSGRRLLSNFCGAGLEIGGPSQFFQPGREFPIYSVAENIDNVNYSATTFWEGALNEGRNFRYNANKAPGHQFICEASDLSAISDCTYDFVASCHTLEHCANPIKSLTEWRRVLKSKGWFALVLPHKEGTFDHRRKVTEFEHLLEDYRHGVTEDDTTHFAEILAIHDLARDPAQKSRQGFEKWISENTVTRGAHHHVFDPALAITLVDHAGFELVSAEALMPFHIFIVAQKSSKRREEKEQIRLQTLRACCERSPFKSDRERDLPESFG